MRKGIRRYFKDAFYADQGASLLRRVADARGIAAGHEHAEALHDWRVLSRRLIEFTKLWARRPLRRQVLPIAGPWIEATNAARDAEVEQAMLEALKKENNAWAAELERFAAPAAEAVRTGNEELTAYLADPARTEEERRLEAIFTTLPRFPHVPERLPRRLRKAIKRFLALADRQHADLKSLHRLRLAAKGLRYGCEPLAALDSELKPVLDELTALQRALGEHRDWSRLAEKSRAAGLTDELIRTMEDHAEKSLAGRPNRLEETESLIEGGWSPPMLSARLLRRRLLRELPGEGKREVTEALELAQQINKGRKRADETAALIQPLRVALSLIVEGGQREGDMLTAALVGTAAIGCPPLTEDVLAERFGGEIVGAAHVLEPENGSAEESRERLNAAPAWIRTVALARELEQLRFAAETATARRETAAHARMLLPVFTALEEPGARVLLDQLERLLDLFPAPTPEG